MFFYIRIYRKLQFLIWIYFKSTEIIRQNLAFRNVIVMEFAFLFLLLEGLQRLT